MLTYVEMSLANGKHVSVLLRKKFYNVCPWKSGNKVVVTMRKITTPEIKIKLTLKNVKIEVRIIYTNSDKQLS